MAKVQKSGVALGVITLGRLGNHSGCQHCHCQVSGVSGRPCKPIPNSQFLRPDLLSSPLFGSACPTRCSWKCSTQHTTGRGCLAASRRSRYSAVGVIGPRPTGLVRGGGNVS